MQSIKYYNHKNACPINLEKDGCDLVDWISLNNHAVYTNHTDGFKIFLPPDRIEISDEYLHADPYGVEESLESSFQVRRKEVTCDLLYFAVANIHGTPQVLDLGCGQGHITEALRLSVDSAEFSGLDYSVSAISYAHKHFKGIDFIVADAYTTPYTDGFFDIVVCNNLWEHVPDPLMLLAEIKRILKAGGFLIVSTPSRYRWGNLVRVLRGKPVSFMSKHHVTEYTIGQVKEQLSYGGFDVIRLASRSLPTRRLSTRVVRKMLDMWVSLTGSHHQLESTVFYLAKNHQNLKSEIPQKD